MTIGFADDVLLYLQVLVDEVGRACRVGHNATHKGSGKHDNIGLLAVEKVAHRDGIHQIHLGVGTADKVAVAFLLQYVPDSRAHQAVVTGDVYFVRFFHRALSLSRFPPLCGQVR